MHPSHVVRLVLETCAQARLPESPPLGASSFIQSFHKYLLKAYFWSRAWRCNDEQDWKQLGSHGVSKVGEKTDNNKNIYTNKIKAESDKCYLKNKRGRSERKQPCLPPTFYLCPITSVEPEVFFFKLQFLLSCLSSWLGLSHRPRGRGLSIGWCQILQKCLGRRMVTTITLSDSSMVRSHTGAKFFLFVSVEVLHISGLSLPRC